MDPEDDIHNCAQAQAERARQANAERARRYRAARKDQGKPDSNATDQAIAEAVSYLVSVAIPNGKSVNIDVKELHRIAVINLHRDGYDRMYSKTAIVQRMKSRSAHDLPHYMPSRRLTPVDRAIQPPRQGLWTEQDLGFIRRLLIRWRDAVHPTR